MFKRGLRETLPRACACRFDRETMRLVEIDAEGMDVKIDNEESGGAGGGGDGGGGGGHDGAQSNVVRKAPASKGAANNKQSLSLSRTVNHSEAAQRELESLQQNEIGLGHDMLAAARSKKTASRTVTTVSKSKSKPVLDATGPPHEIIME